MPYSLGLLTSLFGFAVFFLVVAWLLPGTGLVTFAIATLASLAGSGLAVAVVRAARGRRG